MDDFGYYTVKAINIEGEAKCECVLNILPGNNNISMATEQMNIQTHGFPPEFLQLFIDRQTAVNSTVKFEARITGTPPLNVKINKTNIFFLFLYCC